MQPNELAEDRTGIINKTIVSVLEGKYLHEKIPSFLTLETYDETHIFIPVDITDGAVELVKQNRLGGSSSGGTNLEALQGWILKFGKEKK